MIVAQIGVVAILAIVAGALGGYAAVACAPAVPHATLVIQDVTVVDVERGSLREGLTVAISENRIAAIGPNAELEKEWAAFTLTLKL